MEEIGFLKVTTESPKCFNETFLIFVKYVCRTFLKFVSNCDKRQNRWITTQRFSYKAFLYAYLLIDLMRQIRFHLFSQSENEYSDFPSL